VLNLSVGSQVVAAGKNAIRTNEGARGHAIYGPYVQVEPGRHVVEFTLALAEHVAAEPDRACAVVDIVSDYGKRDIAFDFVMLSDLGTDFRTVALAFDLDEAQSLEFRVYTTGRFPLVIQDEPVLRPRTPGDPDRSSALDRHNYALRELFERDVPFSISRDQVNLRIPREQVGDLFGLDNASADDVARQIAERVAFKGDDHNALYRAYVGTDHPIVSPPREVPFTSTLCQQAHFGYDQYRFWARALKDKPKFYRKQWEFVFIAQALFERGFLAPGKNGLVFGAGQEPLPALFASFGVEVLATDQGAENAERTGWAATHQHTFDLSALNQLGICTDRMFRDLVSFMPVDMNAIPASLDGRFDFCWSACALEHLGSLEHGLAFIENSMRTLRPGGIAVHTTEFNLSSNEDTLESPNCSFYRRRDIEDVVARLERRGYQVSPLDWSVGEGFAERVVDLPPFGRGEPHIRLRADRYDVTSIGLIIQAP